MGPGMTDRHHILYSPLKTSGLWSYSMCVLHTVSLHLVASPRSTRYSLLLWGDPGGPSKKFSGLTSPWTYPAKVFERIVTSQIERKGRESVVNASWGRGARSARDLTRARTYPCCEDSRE